MEIDGTISIFHDRLRSDEALQQLAEYSSQMPLVLRVGLHLSQGLRQQELSEDQADISLSSEQEETVFLLHKSSKQEHELVSEQLLHDTTSISSEPSELLGQLLFQVLLQL